MDALEVAGWAGLGLAIVLQWAFVALYGTGTWYRDFVGRAIMSKSTVIAVALTSTAVHAIFDYAHEQEVRTAIMWAITITVAYQLAALLKQRRIDQGTHGEGPRSEATSHRTPT